MWWCIFEAVREEIGPLALYLSSCTQRRILSAVGLPVSPELALLYSLFTGTWELLKLFPSSPVFFIMTMLKTRHGLDSHTGQRRLFAWKISCLGRGRLSAYHTCTPSDVWRFRCRSGSWDSG